MGSQRLITGVVGLQRLLLRSRSKRVPRLRFSGEIGGAVPVNAPHRGVGPVSQEHNQTIGLAVARRLMQRGPALVIYGVNARSVVQERLDTLAVPIRCCVVQRNQPIVIWRVHVSSGVEQKRHDLNLSMSGSRVQQ